ncbi:MAG: FAD-dependent oxidoreductase [Clostridiales bacterium]|jgi:thioredoxin reductase (NADPH)|nr:FAD-dependent oxidoreductase [Clostridiales bacterium]
MYDTIIIGAGTAGMTAAIYLRRAGKKVLIFERENTGGQIVYSPKIENYPAIASIGGADYAMRLFGQAENQGAQFEFDEILSIKKEEAKGEKTFFALSGSKTYEAKSIIIASGVKHRRLGLEHENKFSGAGLSYCAVCDGAFFKGKTVAVVGGGSTALTDALFLSNTSKKVYLIHRRDGFRGERRLVESLKEKENVEFVMNSEIKELIGGETLSAVKVFDKKTAQESVITLQGLFVAIGFLPANAAFKDIVALDGDGYIEAREDCKTSEAGIFTAGDCRTKEVRQLATAAADGAVAALAACKYLA